MLTLVLIIIAYLLGSLSAGIILCKIMGMPDPRLGGSNNPGATNVLRLAGKKMAIITLVGDALKGVIAVWLAQLMGLNPAQQAWVGVAAFFGHLYPVFFDFKGGKGVATAVGVLFALSPELGGVALFTWLLTAFASRYSSLSALVASVITPFAAWFILGRSVFVPIVLMSALLIYRHLANIKRLRDGTEPKIGG